MSDLTISFSHPWLLLLIIPALFITLFPYFRIAKRYRRTRNRIVSMVLHTIVMVLCISVFSGISFNYHEPNLNNEVILLVDVSFSGEEEAEERDNFIYDILSIGGDQVKMGIVTFGYGQVYAAPLSYDYKDVYNQYITSEFPDTSATDVASALEYAATLFKNPESGKIVLISDGLETDGEAKSIIKSVTAEGIHVDTVCFSTESNPNEVQLVGVEVPDRTILVGDVFELGVTVQSSYEGTATVTLYDNDDVYDNPETEGVVDGVLTVDIKNGMQTFTVPQFMFLIPGLHQISFEIENDEDTLTVNNRFCSYVYLEVFDKILIVERNPGEADSLNNLLTDEMLRVQDYQVDVVNIYGDDLPTTLDDLRAYDQVILVNVAYQDMPAGFEEMLYSYVYEIGGGLLTVGGNQYDDNGSVLLDQDGNPIPNAYNREDMANSTLFRQMLPVEAIDYTPPVGVVILIDKSGSMESENKLELAKEGATACLGALTERDYCAIMTLDDGFTDDLQMVPMPEAEKLRAAIERIEIGGGTVYTGALEEAGRALTALDVERRHIILVSDGQPSDDLFDDPESQTGGYGGVIRHFYETSGITCSIVAIGVPPSNKEEMARAAALGHGRFYDVWDVDTLPQSMRSDLEVPEIKSVNIQPFTPKINKNNFLVSGVSQSDMPQLGGYYGTRARSRAEVILMGPYVPIYANWTFGAGKVGSFMCDLKGTADSWSSEFMSSSTGIRFINNVITSLFPSENIRPKEITLQLSEDNYTNHLSMFFSSGVEEGSTVQVEITGPPDENGQVLVQTLQPSAAQGYSRVTFAATRPGIHKIVVRKLAADGSIIAQTTAYKSFSWSEEYNIFVDGENGRVYLEELAAAGDGISVQNAWEVFDSLVLQFDRTFDPRFAFIITSIILLLLDIAVRKFKFKWPHELVRDHKAKKALIDGEK